MIRRSGSAFPLLILALAPALVACGISVQKDDDGHNKNVNITSPVGNVSVKANSDTAPDTGLPVHAGARLVRDRDDANADVNVQSGIFGVKVAVAKYEDEETPEALLDFYRKEMGKYGSVVECRGNIDFRKAGPRCKERERDEMQLGVGSEGDNRIVAVKPRGAGSEFTLIHVQTRS